MKTVQIFTSSTCPVCHEAKAFLDSKGVDYDEFNISVDVEARKFLMSQGIRSVPVIISGGQAMLGFDPIETGKLLGLLDTSAN